MTEGDIGSWCLRQDIPVGHACTLSQVGIHHDMSMLWMLLGYKTLTSRHNSSVWSFCWWWCVNKILKTYAVHQPTPTLWGGEFHGFKSSSACGFGRARASCAGDGEFSSWSSQDNDLSNSYLSLLSMALCFNRRGQGLVSSMSG